MSTDDIYVNYQPESPPRLVPRAKQRLKAGLTPAASCLDLNADVTLDHALHPAQIGFKTPNGLNAELDDDLGACCHHYEPKISRALGAKHKLPSAGMFHAHSMPNLANATDELDNGMQLPKKKKKRFQRFLNFLRNVKKGKDKLEIFIHHPIMKELGVPDLLEGAKDMTIDALRSQIGI